MKIKRLELEDFRNHKHTTIDMDAKFVVFRGANFSGKTSIAQAISMCLTPSTTSLDATGRGFQTKIRRGESRAIITADIQGGKHLVRNTVKLDTNTTGRTSRSVCLDDDTWHCGPFDKMLESNRVPLSVALNTDAFMNMDEKAQKALLAKLALPEHYDFPEEVTTQVARLIGVDAVDFDAEPFSVIEKAYKLLYKEREGLNREVKAFVFPEPIKLENPSLTSDKLQALLSEARDARQAILTKRDAAVKKAGDGEVERAKLETRLTALEEKIKEETEKLRAAEAKMLTDARYKEALRIAGNKAKHDQITQARTELAGQVRAAKTALANMGSIAGSDGECGACGQKVTAEYMGNLKAHYEEKISRGAVDDDALLQELKALGNVEGAGNALAQHDAANKDCETIAGILSEKAKLLKDGRAKLEAMGVKVDAAAPFAEPIAEADKKIADLTDQLRPVIAAEERTKDVEKKIEQLSKMQAKAELADKLVRLFDKDGIKAKLLSQHIGDFESKLNSTLDAWGYQASLSIEPYMLAVKDSKGITTPVQELSGSEQLMFSYALQCAVSRAAGLGIVVADRLDTFLPEQRKKANHRFYESVTNGELDQVILLVSDESETVPNLPESAFFKVQDGMAWRLGE